MESPVQSAEGVGLYIPPRQSDCTGLHPSWRPIVLNVCDQDDPDPLPLSGRQLEVPAP